MYNSSTHTINGKEFIVFQIPKETYDCVIVSGKLIIKKAYEFYQEWDDKILPNGNWKISKDLCESERDQLIKDCPFNKKIVVLEKE